MSDTHKTTGRYSAAGRVKLLHIEDDPDFLAYIKALLDDIAEIDQARTLRQSQGLISLIDYDLILLDMNLPDGSGMDIVTDLKTNRPEIPIVIFSVDNVTPNIDHVAHVFQKGHFDEQSLVGTIRALTA